MAKNRSPLGWFRWFVLGDYQTMQQEWDARVAHAPPPDPKGVEVVAALLEKQLERAVESSRSIETRASLVIPAIAATVGLLASDVGFKIAEGLDKNPWAFWLGVGMVAAGGFAAIAALLALSPRARSNGPEPLLAVFGRGESAVSARGHYVAALGFAVRSSEELVRIQAFCLNGSLRAIVAALVLLIFFGVAGGFAGE